MSGSTPTSLSTPASLSTAAPVPVPVSAAVPAPDAASPQQPTAQPTAQPTVRSMTPFLYRLGGAALVIGAAAHLVYWPFHPPGHDIAQQLDPRWAPAHVVGLLSALALLVGLPAVYLRQADRLGWPGLLGAALGFLQALVLVDLSLFEALVVPVLVADPATRALTGADGVLANGPLGVLGPTAWLAFLLTTSAGYILFGLALLRAGLLPRGGALLVALSGAVHLALPLGFVFHLVGFVLRFVGFGWLGWGLLRLPHLPRARG